MTHSPSLRQKWLNLGIIFFLKPNGGFRIQFPKGIMNPELEKEIKSYKPKILHWLLQEKKKVEENQKKKDSQQIYLKELSSEQITHYRLLLEEFYKNPDNDFLHDDDTPRHFREGTHTFDMMECALERFIHQKKNEESFLFKLTQHETEIIQSYPILLHPLLRVLVQTSKLKDRARVYTTEELANFRHNMGHLFVNVNDYAERWHPADLRTLWSEGWREQDILSFMMSKKVKYILCHNSKIIQCLDLNNAVHVFEKNRSNSSEHNPVEEDV